ncbi:unnamed protein product [Cuscuta campestris]|uniref:RNase H type-1 domain-containing protein n=1 Tax=Cuscuta campestris TaxID=132261 RepID=A0A484MKG8_9ASTE|nr:unnamed protein product [Cuscuta campestris]
MRVAHGGAAAACRRVIIRNWHKDGGSMVEVAWEKPKVGWTKLNFDGSCRWETGASSIGGVFRDHDAEFLFGYAEPIVGPVSSSSDSNVAEFAALRRGLQILTEDDNRWITQKGTLHNNLWIEGDSKNLVDAVLHREPRRRRFKWEDFQEQVEEIRLMIRRLKTFCRCDLTHVYKEGNRAAHKLAEIGHRLQSPQVWRRLAPPPQLLPILSQDAQAKVIQRRIRHTKLC